jgi:DNA primase
MLRTKRLERINQLALKYFIKHLHKSKRAQRYLSDRISKKIAKQYFIGYAPNGGFIDYLNKHGVNEREGKELGLVVLDYDGNAYERFANRIMIPIIHAGRLLGFGGRIIGDGEPKYINSKASILYNKGEVLYGLWKARKPMDRLGYGFLVEGYFDVLGLATHKVYNCVASCGTAFTLNQARLLKRYTDRVYTMLDGDDAGQEAAKKAKKILKKAHIYAGNLKLPKKMDPDTFVRRYGRKALNKVKVTK